MMGNENSYEKLKKELSLFHGGGIDFISEKADVDKTQAILFVGLGGSGADAILHIKKECLNRLNTTGNIGFLEIDSDLYVKKAGWQNVSWDETENEFCDICVPDIYAAYREVIHWKECGMKEWQWISENPNINLGTGTMGAGGLRQIGRMLLFLNIGKILNQIEKKIFSLLNSGAMELKIVIYSGISGGTGSGILLDMAYIMRKIAKRKWANVKIEGHLLMPDIHTHQRHRDILYANGYACLKELDYWMNAQAEGKSYCQQITPDFVLNESESPFDACHIWNAMGYVRSYEEILSSMAMHAIAHAKGELKACYSIISGIGNHKYTAIGAGELEVPYKEISTLFIARLFENMSKGVFLNRPNGEKFEKMIREELRLSIDRMSFDLTCKCERCPDLLKYKASDIWNNVGKMDPVYSEADSWLRCFYKWVTSQWQEVLKSFEENFIEFIKRNLCNTETGPMFLRYFVKSHEEYCLYHRLRAFEKYCESVIANANSKSQELKREMEIRYEAGRQSFSFLRSKAAKAYVNAVDIWCRNEADIIVHKEILNILSVIQKKADTYYEKILYPLTEKLHVVSDVFKDNLNYVRRMGAGQSHVITAAEFENLKKNEFENAMIKSEGVFWDEMKNRLCEWIGRDIDDVENIQDEQINIPGFLASFIPKDIREVMKIDIEEAMNLVKGRFGQQMPAQDAVETTELLLQDSPVYFNENLWHEKIEFRNFSVSPGVIMNNLNNYINDHYYHYLVNLSSEREKFYVIKVKHGYTLSENAYMEDMEMAYNMVCNNTQNSTWMGCDSIHLNPEWSGMPSLCED